MRNIHIFFAQKFLGRGIRRLDDNMDVGKPVEGAEECVT
jgi:hypothetical protein